MESIHKLEKTVAGWYKGMPHMPASGQKWLAANVWWIALIGVVLSAMAIFTLAGILLVAGTVATGVGVAYGTGYGTAGAVLVGAALLAAWVALAFLVLQTVVLAMAISPLKSLKKKGWDLLFILALINVASAIVSGVISFNLMSIVYSLLWSAIGAYFLFEIRGQFGAPEKLPRGDKAEKAEAKPAKKEAKA